jgi:hypothetical protein
MTYVYAGVDDLENTDKVGSRQCVALLQTYAHLPATALWREGKAVEDAGLIVKGTAVATFVDGRYPSHATGNHAGFFIARGAGGGFWIMDQWASDATKPKVSKRFIRHKGKSESGAYLDPSNNAAAYSIIE